MELTRENFCKEIKRAQRAGQEIVSISLTDEDIRKMSQLGTDEWGSNYEETFRVGPLFGWKIITGSDVSTINVSLH